MAAEPHNEPRRRTIVPAERRRLIAERLRETGSITVASLESEFGVSPMTARRDLALLEREGRARRTHGGAVLPELASHEDSFLHRLEQATEVKQRLADAAVGRLEAHETVFVDGSTSAYFAVRRMLESGIALTILTNSVPIMDLVGTAESPNVALVGLGGSFRKLTRSFVGPDTVTALAGYFVDKVIFSVKGITQEGYLTDPDELEAEVKRTMIAHARTAVLLADATKFEDRSLNVIAPLERVALAVLADPPPDAERIVAAAGVELLRA